MELSDRLYNILQSVGSVSPELIAAMAFVLVLLAEIYFSVKNTPESEKNAILWGVCLVTVLFLNFQLSNSWQNLGTKSEAFSGQISIDASTQYFKLLLYISALIMLAHIRFLKYEMRSEYYSLFLFQLIGLQLLLHAQHFLLLYLAIEIVSVASYVFVAMSAHAQAREATIKYALFGAVGTAIMLYGISLYYGITGSLGINPNEVSRYLHQTDSKVLHLVFLMISAGFLFKISAFPMHIWAPDVFQTTSSPVISYLSIAPKVAGILAFIRIVLIMPENQQVLVAVLAISSIGFGNFAALRQHDMKRMLAYSGIAQIGFVLAAVACVGRQGLQAAYFYLFIYLFANMALFLLLNLAKKLGQLANYQAESFAGLAFQNKYWAAALVLVLVSLIGLPPTAGFSSKLFVFSALWNQYQLNDNIWYLALLIFGLLNTAVSLYYYVKIPYFAFFKKGTATAFLISIQLKVLIALLCLPLLYYFFYADTLLNWLGQLLAL